MMPHFYTSVMTIETTIPPYCARDLSLPSAVLAWSAGGQKSINKTAAVVRTAEQEWTGPVICFIIWPPKNTHRSLAGNSPVIEVTHSKWLHTLRSQWKSFKIIVCLCNLIGKLHRTNQPHDSVVWSGTFIEWTAWFEMSDPQWWKRQLTII